MRLSDAYLGGVSVALALFFAAAGVAVVRYGIGFLRFRARLRAALDATPDIQWQRWTGRGLVAAVSGYPLELDLVPTYLHLRLRRPREQTLFADLADALRSRVPSAAVPPLLLVRDRILPVLKGRGTLPPERGYAAENILARRPLDDEVTVAYVIEGQFRMTYITRGMLEPWNMDGDALHALALENLREQTRHLLREIGEPRREYAALDGYDAARLLVADLLVPPDVADPLFAIPHEHLCLIAPSDRRRELRAAALRAYRDAPLPLTTALYRWSAAGPERIT
jgi:hypothetical protein